MTAIAPVNESRERRWEADELDAIWTLEGAALERFAAIAHRDIGRVYSVRDALRTARRARNACPAFIPDNGLPYRARMARILREARVL